MAFPKSPSSDVQTGLISGVSSCAVKNFAGKRLKMRLCGDVSADFAHEVQKLITNMVMAD